MTARTRLRHGLGVVTAPAVLDRGQRNAPVARRAYVYEELVRTAEETQAPLRAELQERGLTYKPYYLINMIRVDGHHRLQEQFAGLPGVADVLYNPNVRPYPAHTALGTLPATFMCSVARRTRRFAR